MYVYFAVLHKFLQLVIEHNQFRNSYHWSYLILSYVYFRSRFPDFSFCGSRLVVSKYRHLNFQFLMISSNRINVHSLLGVKNFKSWFGASPVNPNNCSLFLGLSFLSYKVKGLSTGYVLWLDRCFLDFKGCAVFWVQKALGNTGGASRFPAVPGLYFLMQCLSLFTSQY